jgi:hypothetical protein
MSKRFLIWMALMGSFTNTLGATPERVTIDFQSKQRLICGFEFAPVKDLVVVAKRILEQSLRTRIDNERYAACPFNVVLTYKGIDVRLDFSRDVTLSRIRAQGDEDPVQVAFFRHSESGWAAVGSDVDIAGKGILIRESDASLSVSAILRRVRRDSEKPDFCFNINVIGAQKFLSGATCRPKMQELEKLDTIFRDGNIISAKN